MTVLLENEYMTIPGIIYWQSSSVVFWFTFMLWILSTIHKASGYFSIPCCSWALDAKFERSSTAVYHVPDADFSDTLNLGGDDIPS
jgi:hypothetical protein